MNEQVPPAGASTASSRIKVVIVIATLVIAIISFLFLLRAPTESRDYGHTLQCTSNVRALGLAIALFAQAHNSLLKNIWKV